MRKIYFIVLAFVLASCASNQNSSEVATKIYPPQTRVPAATNGKDLTGTSLGEGLFSKRKTGIKRPAMRVYLDRAEGEADSYYGVLVEYDQLLAMALPYLSSQKAPILNHVVGYLDKIATRISAYKFVPGQKAGTYNMHNLEVRNGQIVPASAISMVLNLDPKNKSAYPLQGAVITGNKDGLINLGAPKAAKGIFSGIGDLLTTTQLELAMTTYKLGHLASTWRGNWNDLQGSYLSEYGRFTDGVLELYLQNGQAKAKFIKTNTTQAKYFTNPKSAVIEGDFIVSEPIPKMYLMVPTARGTTASDVEMRGRIGLMLDVFDGSAPEAGSHLVTELAYTNPHDPEDFMMYYEHPEHVKNVGVEAK